MSGDLAWLIPAARKPKTIVPIRPIRGYEPHLRGGLVENTEMTTASTPAAACTSGPCRPASISSRIRAASAIAVSMRGDPLDRIVVRSPPLEFIQQVARRERHRASVGSTEARQVEERVTS